jgi:alpha-tubulin suppressor-like RCC1 family protein
MPSYYGAATTRFKQDGQDIGDIYVTRDFLIEKYPNLADILRSATMFSSGTAANSQMIALLVNTSSPTIQNRDNNKWKKMASGGATSVLHRGAIKTDGTLWMWGRNAAGQLGDGSTTNRNLVQITVNSGDWLDISCGSDFSVGINGQSTLIPTVLVTGNNSFGQLGSGAGASVTTWQQAGTILSNLSPVLVSCGQSSTFLLSANGQLSGVGLNTSGQLGDGTTINRSSPVQTAAGGTWRKVSAGTSHAIAIKTDGTLWGWGLNTSGQVGDNTRTTRSSPVQVDGGGTDWKQVTCAGSSSFAIKTDGTLYGWGGNQFGGLGDGSTSSRSTPGQTVTQGSNWKSVATSGRHCAAIKTDGTLWTWGDNSSGQLGDGTTVSKSSPAQTISGGTDWKFATAMLQATHIVKDTTQDLWL